MKIIQAIGSLSFLLYLYSSIALFGILILFAPLLFFFPGLQYEIARLWARSVLLVLKISCGLEHEIIGLENLPKDNCIILSKHSSTWETISLMTLLPRQTWVIKKEILFFPIFGQLLLFFKPIPIDRNAGKNAVQQIISKGEERLNNGLFVVIFPEGTRTSFPFAGRYGLGGSILSIHSGYPVVPIAHNAGKYWPRNTIIKKRGKITVQIGQAIYTSKEDYPEKISKSVKEWIEKKIVKF